MKKNILSSFYLISILLLWASCDEQPLFVPAEFRISAEDTEGVLNLIPQFILSDNTSVAIADINNGNIVITSAGEGRTTVRFGDKIGFSNQASIRLFVDETGKIKIEEIKEFDGRAVNPNIKYAVTINGVTNSEILKKRIDLQMNGTHFIVTEDMDVTSWFVNLPKGLTAEIFETFASNPERGPNEVYIYISGIPQSVSSDVIRIIVPGINTGRGWDVYFSIRSDALFDITN